MNTALKVMGSFVISGIICFSLYRTVKYEVEIQVNKKMREYEESRKMKEYEESRKSSE